MYLKLVTIQECIGAFCESLYFQAAFMNYALTVSNLFPFKPIIIEIFNLLHFYIRRTGLFLKDRNVQICDWLHTQQKQEVRWSTI